MKSQEVRDKFLKFFQSKGHEIIASSSLIPYDDPTLLFANAGMNQFKDYFTGKARPHTKRATTAQKCVRAGGKHNDLENVGFTARHHTFFEMLGNFSFGDYFKKDAIAFAWELLTHEYKIPKEKLYITVHHSDDEAMQIWHKQEGVPLERIFKRGDKDNFWEMGEYGPCGPCSEIFYDHGEKYTTPGFVPGPGQSLLDDEQRYVEIWNLVFMQYEKTPEGQLKLPNPSIDTGAGLERLTAALQGKYWNYDTDLFTPIIKQIEKLSGKSYQDPKYINSFRVVADHIRSSTMLITDGAIPSNEGRGYVLRRIIRRAVRHLRELELKEVTLYKLVPAVFEVLGDSYPGNKANQALAEKLLQLEEKKFLETLDQGLRFLNEALEKELVNNTLPGEAAFKLYDTFGFPLDLTEVILREKNLSLDMEGFQKAMSRQKEVSKKSWKGAMSEEGKKTFFSLKEKHGATRFVGYETCETSAKLLAIQKIGEDFGLIFDQTPLYGESGGQVGDRGEVLDSGHVLANIHDTQKPVDELIVHYSTDADALEVGKTYTLRVASKRRELTKRNHSATHLLQAALIKVLGDHVKQAGSLVSHEKLRFDFTHPERLKEEEIIAVEALVNEQIKAARTVSSKVMTKENALKEGALAFFGEKYSDQVRVLKMGDFSTELCGGTHVNNTSEIGLFKILNEGALASGVRRIEAITSDTAMEHLYQRSKILTELEELLGAKSEKLIDRTQTLLRELKEKNKEVEQLVEKLQSLQGEELFAHPDKLPNGILYKEAQVTEDADLRKLSDLFISKYPEGVVLLYGKKGDKVSVLLRAGKSLAKVNCSQIMKEAFPLINGRGGGRPDMVQGSGDNAENITSFKNKVKELLGATK